MQKAFEKKIKHTFMMKTLNKLGIKRNFLTLLKGVCEKPIDNIIRNGERLKGFSLITSESIWGCLFLPLLFNTVLEVLTRVIRQKRKKRQRQRDSKRERVREASRLDAKYAWGCVNVYNFLFIIDFWVSFTWTDTRMCGLHLLDCWPIFLQAGSHEQWA